MKEKNDSTSPNKVDRILSVVSSMMAVVGAGALALMMLLTVGDVFGRFFFKLPIEGAFELIAFAMVFAMTWGLPHCQMQKGHIRIGVFLKLFPEKSQDLVNGISYLTGLVCFSLLTWQMFVRGKQYIALGDAGTTEALGIPSWPFMMAFVISAGLFSLVLLVDVVRSFAKVIKR